MPQTEGNNPEEEKKEEEQQPVQEQAPSSDGAMSQADLAAIKAELEAEKKAIAEARALIQERDSHIQKLQATISAVQQAADTANAELAQTRDAYTRAVAKYLEMARALNPTIPQDAIAGSTIDEIDASVAKAKSIAEAVKKALEAEAAQTRVPAGAPVRAGVSLEGLSPREKIIAGLAHKGG